MGNRNVAGDYDKKPSAKSAVLTVSDQLLKETVAILCREKVFPKRSRWIIAEPIVSIVNKYHTFVSYANGIHVVDHATFAERYKAQTLAIAWHYALNVKMTAAQLILDAPIDAFDHWQRIWNRAKDLTYAWRNSDRKRFEEKFSSLSADELKGSSISSP